MIIRKYSKLKGRYLFQAGDRVKMKDLYKSFGFYDTIIKYVKVSEIDSLHSGVELVVEDGCKDAQLNEVIYELDTVWYITNCRLMQIKKIIS